MGRSTLDGYKTQRKKKVFRTPARSRRIGHGYVTEKEATSSGRRLFRHGSRYLVSPERSRIILEEFDGFVDQVDGGTAHITLTATSREQFYGEYPADELAKLGIRERRRFKCRTVDVGTGVEIEFEAIPDRALTQEQVRAINERLDHLLGDDDAPQDDY